MREYYRLYANKRYKTDVEYKLRAILRVRLNEALKLKNASKSNSAIKLLGITIPEFKVYLESKFYIHPITGESMTWVNHGKGPEKWNIDHIKPLVSFELQIFQQQQEACHYTNLQPLWEPDNLSKGCKLFC